MLDEIVAKEIRKKGLSVRSAARQMGVSHTTLFRVIEGKHTDLRTLDKVAKWLRVSPSALIDAIAAPPIEGEEDVAAIFSVHPELVQLLTEIIGMCPAKQLDFELLEEVLAFTAFRVNRIYGKSKPIQTNEVIATDNAAAMSG